MTDTEAVRQCRGEGYLGEVAAQAGEGCRVYGDLLVNKVRVVAVVAVVGWWVGLFHLFYIYFIYFIMYLLFRSCVADALMPPSKPLKFALERAF